MPSSNRAILQQIINSLLDENTPKMMTLIQNLNGKYEFAHLA
jgi:hypothetical protein